MIRKTSSVYRSLRLAPSTRPLSPPRRPLHTPARQAAQAASTVFPASTTRSDSPLLQVFDSPDSTVPSRTSSLAPSGLFGQPLLTSPLAFPALARSTTLRAQVIVARICSPQPTPVSQEDAERQFLLMVKNLDRLSDLLCGVIDLAEVVRNVHPDGEWNEGANLAYEELCAYMNTLNTHVGLYEALKSIKALLPSSTPTKSPELFAAYAVAVPFLRDFEKSGIHLPDSQRSQYVTLSSAILQLGRRFLQNAGEPRAPVGVTAQELGEAMGAGAARRFLGGHERGEIDPHSWEGRVLARQHPDARLRKRFTLAAQSAPLDHIETLDTLLRTRAQLADLVGRNSWGDVALEDKMARTPENVLGFLENLNRHNRPLALKDLKLLQDAKEQDLGRRAGRVESWDRDFYSDRAATSHSPLPDISPFFSVGSCFLGLSRLFSSLYGIRFEVEDTQVGETWESQVRKLRVVDEHEGVIGTIYADLFAREGKQAGAAHYTVRCSRRIDDDDVSGDFSSSPEGYATLEDGQRVYPSDVPDSSLLSVEGVQWKGRDGTHQEPIIVLVCGFGQEGRQGGEKAFLHWHEVETLFHEMGHAIHSMIGRTEYHNVSGTRCATDFVELPSILMEHFVASPSVLDLFAKHHQTGRTLPRGVLADLLKERQRFSALETSSQITMAALDQWYHSSEALSPHFKSSAYLSQAHDTFHVIPHAEGTAWQTQFGHLFGYGATYYSYLFDRSIAARIFGQLFADDPLSRESGEKFKGKLLKWGGGREPWEMVGEVVECEKVMRGDGEAMSEVGRWGIEAARQGK